jgi:hypothetical protein
MGENKDLARFAPATTWGPGLFLAPLKVGRIKLWRGGKGQGGGGVHIYIYQGKEIIFLSIRHCRENQLVNSTNFLLDHVAYLHDARCLELTWDCSRPGDRAIRLKLVVDPDAELPSWNGKTLVISLSDVVAARFMGWGYTTGQDSIDNWSQGVSDFLERECKVLASKGIKIPLLRFTISFHSGSELEVICSEASALVAE